MAVFLSPGVFTREIDLGLTTTSQGPTLPAFVGTAKKGPIGSPMLITNPQQYIDTYGEPFPESYLGYAVLAYLEEGESCIVMRVGVECRDGQDDDIADICIDTSGLKVAGWGRLPLFSGIDFGRINFREVTTANPLTFHAASVSIAVFNDTDASDPTEADLDVTGTYTGVTDDVYTLVVTSDGETTSDYYLHNATFDVIRSSDNSTVATGTFSDSGNTGTSQTISIGDGLTVQVIVTDGKLVTGDSFTFTAAPDNRSFEIAIEDDTPTTYQMTATSYTTAAAFVAAANAIIGGSEEFEFAAVVVGGVTIPQARTVIAGRTIQIAGSEAWATTMGQSLHAYDIPRSYLYGALAGPYDLTTQNNQITLDVVGAAETLRFAFTIATGLGLSAAAVAGLIDPNGLADGSYYFRAKEWTVPGGTKVVLLLTTIDNPYDQLVMLANYSHLKTLRFTEEVGIEYPYRRSSRGFSDTRVALPDPGVTDPAIPLSCESDPSGTDCSDDTAYFQNIVGFLVATSPGTWLDDYTVDLSLYTQGVGDVSGRYQLTIKDAAGVVVDNVDDVSFDKTADRYIANVVNPATTYGGRNGNPYVNWEERPSYLNFDETDESTYEIRNPAPFVGREFAGMANGIPTDPADSTLLDAAVIGNPALNTGIFAFQNPETYDIDLLVTPGFSSGAVIAQGLQLCEGRGDVLYLVDPPFGLKPSQVIDWHNGMLESDLTAAINSSYGALQWAWVEVFDQFSRNHIWIPPSGHTAAAYARTSKVAEQWYPAAGLRRGRFLTALDIEYSPTLGERDALYGSGNAVNPIVKFPKDGIVLFGDRTLQRTASVLDRAPVRMLLSYLKKNMTAMLRNFIFELNDEILWEQVKNVLNPFLGDVQARRGMTGYKLVVDASNNTPERRDRHELWVSTFLKPTPTVEFVVLNLVTLRTGASFASAEVLAAGGIVGG